MIDRSVVDRSLLDEYGYEDGRIIDKDKLQEYVDERMSIDNAEDSEDAEKIDKAVNAIDTLPSRSAFTLHVEAMTYIDELINLSVVQENLDTIYSIWEAGQNGAVTVSTDIGSIEGGCVSSLLGWLQDAGVGIVQLQALYEEVITKYEQRFPEVERLVVDLRVLYECLLDVVSVCMEHIEYQERDGEVDQYELTDEFKTENVGNILLAARDAQRQINVVSSKFEKYYIDLSREAGLVGTTLKERLSLFFAYTIVPAIASWANDNREGPDNEALLSPYYELIQGDVRTEWPDARTGI